MEPEAFLDGLFPCISKGGSESLSVGESIPYRTTLYMGSGQGQGGRYGLYNGWGDFDLHVIYNCFPIEIYNVIRSFSIEILSSDSSLKVHPIYCIKEVLPETETETETELQLRSR